MPTSSEHKRSVVLSHWFYLISEGLPSSGHGTANYIPAIPALGIEQAINIVTEGLLTLDNREADYPDFMEAVEMAVDINWGLCSKESAAIRRAFAKIGMGSGETCAYVHIKPRYCESDAGIQLCIEEGFSDDLYRWYFPSEWTVQGTGNTNSVTGRCLKVLNWPEYDYYPQNFTVRLYNVNKNRSVNYNIRMEDCEGDDPGCNDVELNTFPSSPTAEEKTDNLSDSEPFTLLRVFDINGRKVYEGQNFKQNFVLSNLDELLIYCYYDRQGKIIKTKKMITIK